MKATWRTTADEPASAALRRLHEEMTLPTLKSPESPSASQVAAYFAARATIDSALPALADIVKAAERLRLPRHSQPCYGVEADGYCAKCAMHDALAALRERPEARP